MSNVMKKLTSLAMLSIAVVAVAPTAHAEQGDWLFKIGGTIVDPKSNNLEIAGIGTLQVEEGESLAFTVTYMATNNVGVELLAAVPFKHDIGIKGLGKIGETKHLPPTLSVQYHFMPDSVFSPYAGVGFNWTIFSSEKIDPGVADGLTLDDSTGFAAQIGADFNINEKWLVNLDIRYIDIETDATIRVGTDRVGLGTVKIDPTVYSLMVGYRF